MISTRDRIPVGGNRLDPMLITDPLIRAKLYSDIRKQNPFRGAEDWTEYTVSPGERFMPELIAVRVWNDESLKWAVMVAAELDDPRREIEAGITLNLPSREWLRDRIKFYQALDAIEVPTGELVRIGKFTLTVNVEKPPAPPTGSGGFQQFLEEAIGILNEPIPVLKPSDELTEEQLNKQARAIEARMQAMAIVLDLWRQQKGAGDETQTVETAVAMMQGLPNVRPSDPLNERTLNKQAQSTEQKLAKLRDLLETWRNG